MDILTADLVIIGCMIVFVIIITRAILKGAQSDADKINEDRDRYG